MADNNSYQGHAHLITSGASRLSHSHCYLMTSYSRSVYAGGISKKGDRNHFEDFTFSKYNKRNAFYSVLDGHCGRGAASYVLDNLWENIVSMKGFHSDDIEEVKKAIKHGFMKTQDDMLGKPCTPPRGFSIA